MTTPSETDIRLNPFFPSDEEFVKFMTTPTDKSDPCEGMDETALLELVETLQSQLADLRAHVSELNQLLLVQQESPIKLAKALGESRAQVKAKVEETENSVDEQWIEAISKHWVSLTGKPWETRDGETPEEGRHANVTAIFQYIEDLKSQVERLHADGAVMRGALEWITYNSDMEDLVQRRAADALFTHSGADLLARYREAMTLLERTKGFDMHAADWKWMNRRDTLLATVKGEVES